ncbi:2-hydroxyacid dehydrogenase [Paenibacillus shunpengii]|uniref:2-hydroxyacid dehydrogenase n=1 Tax=Paenibacillus shunpengii TaxID=2054424 RepID=A0ABW5SM62_9BACL|nr:MULTISPECIES: D-glycerate dehydrogenase [unclassified Paenibacillus]OMC67584.1 D-glycerate dehydrogenase [Paenibacillus sp. FSL H7-0326]SDX86715.1 glyoxylate reductase [Paenibacillus sp. PDC88]
MKPKIFITRKIPSSALDKLALICEVDLWDEEEIPVPRDVLEQKVKDVEGLLCLLTEAIDQPLLEKAHRLKVVSNMAVGYNNIDVAEASSRAIMVTNTPGVLTETTADLTFALLMATSRRVVEASQYLRKGEWKTWSPMQLTGQDIYGATMGIIGMGRIGQALAKRAKGFDMRVLYFNRSRKLDAEQENGIEYAELDALLTQSDFVCLMTPLSDETYHLIGKRELELMKSTAVLINTARGGIVDEEALYDALTQGEIWAAGLDVFEQEPIRMDHPLLKLPNVVTLPHIGSASIRTRTLMAELAADNLIRGLLGQRPEHLVND